MWFNSQLKQTIQHRFRPPQRKLQEMINCTDYSCRHEIVLFKGQEISKGNYGVFSSSKNEALEFVSNWVKVILHKRFDNNIK